MTMRRNRKVLRLQLARLGIEARSVDSAQAALKELTDAFDRHQRFDLAVLDHMMPECDGLELARQIAADGRFQAMRLVLLTSAPAVRAGGDIAALGFSAYLIKPVSNRELHETLHRVMSAQSPQSHGSTQSIVLPARKANSQTSGHVLLADDNRVNQKVALGALQRMGLKVDVANNGEEAVAAWAAGIFDLILMDCQMPVMDGYQAAREIRARETRANRTPIIALTADAMKGTEQLCRESGMDDYLTKPIDRERLSEVDQPLFVDHRRCGGPRGEPRTQARWHRDLDCARSIGSASCSQRTMIAILRVNSCRSSLNRAIRCYRISGVPWSAAIWRLLGEPHTRSRDQSANMCASLASEAAARLESAARAGVAEDVAKLEIQLRAETLRAMEYLRARQG